MKNLIIYTDGSLRPKRYGICGVITQDHNIVDILFEEGIPFTKRSAEIEARAIHKSLAYTLNNYNPKQILLFSDCSGEASKWRKYYKEQGLPIKVKYIRGHKLNGGWNHKFNCLADYICKNGTKNWRKWWYGKL